MSDFNFPTSDETAKTIRTAKNQCNLAVWGLCLGVLAVCLVVGIIAAISPPKRPAEKPEPKNVVAVPAAKAAPKAIVKAATAEERHERINKRSMEIYKEELYKDPSLAFLRTRLRMEKEFPAEWLKEEQDRINKSHEKMRRSGSGFIPDED